MVDRFLLELGFNGGSFGPETGVLSLEIL